MFLMRMVVLASLLGALLVGTAGCKTKKQASKKYWITEMKKRLPEEFCKQGGVFRECFKLTKAQCLATAKEATKLCLNRFRSQFPKVFMQPEDGSHWGQKVGLCAGTAFEQKHMALKQDTPACRAAIRAAHGE